VNIKLGTNLKYALFRPNLADTAPTPQMTVTENGRAAVDKVVVVIKRSNIRLLFAGLTCYAPTGPYRWSSIMSVR